MKKCKITLSQSGTKAKQFYLFPESSLLHSLILNANKKNLDFLLKSHPEVEIVTLKRGQWLEVEWNGCHVHWHNNCPISASFLRIAKASSTSKKKNEPSLISVHFGWILTNHMRLIEGDGYNDIHVSSMSEEDEQFDFSELFQDNETIEDIVKKYEQAYVV